MKFLTFLTFLIVTLNLNARENPFEVTNAYEEEKARIMEINEASVYEAMSEDAYIKEMQQKMNELDKKEETKTPISKPMKKQEKVYTKKEVDKIITKTKKQTEYKTKQLIKKEVAKEIKNKEMKSSEQIVYVKPRLDVMEDEEFVLRKILPFVDIQYNDNSIIINSKDKISKKFTLEKENKIVIDYKARKTFYTKRENLDSKNFKKITIGNHKKQMFYRVVVELKKKSSNYKVDYKDNLLTITSIN